MLLHIQDGTLSVGAQTVLAHFDFEIRGNEKIAIVGRNGCGKTTLLRLLAGELSLDRDEMCIRDSPYALHRTQLSYHRASVCSRL